MGPDGLKYSNNPLLNQGKCGFCFLTCRARDMIQSIGRLAQLVERIFDVDEATGSNPVLSTMFNFFRKEPVPVQETEFYERFKVVAEKMTVLKKYEKDNFDFLTADSSDDERELIGGPVESWNRLSYELMECLCEAIEIVKDYPDRWVHGQDKYSDNFNFKIGEHKIRVHLSRPVEQFSVTIGVSLELCFNVQYIEGTFHYTGIYGSVGYLDAKKLDILGQNICDILNTLIQKKDLDFTPATTHTHPPVL